MKEYRQLLFWERDGFHFRRSLGFRGGQTSRWDQPTIGVLKTEGEKK